MLLLKKIVVCRGVHLVGEYLGGLHVSISMVVKIRHHGGPHSGWGGSVDGIVHHRLDTIEWVVKVYRVRVDRVIRARVDRIRVDRIRVDMIRVGRIRVNMIRVYRVREVTTRVR